MKPRMMFVVCHEMLLYHCFVVVIAVDVRTSVDRWIWQILDRNDDCRYYCHPNARYDYNNPGVALDHPRWCVLHFQNIGITNPIQIAWPWPTTIHQHNHYTQHPPTNDPKVPQKDSTERIFVAFSDQGILSQSDGGGRQKRVSNLSSTTKTNPKLGKPTALL